MVGGMKVEGIAEEVAMAVVLNRGGGSEDDCGVCKVLVGGIGNGEREGGDDGQGEEVDSDIEPGEGARWQKECHQRRRQGSL